MSITKEVMFQILNLRTISPDGSFTNMFTPKGDPEYVIEVVGISRI
jgi:hypothetical protein